MSELVRLPECELLVGCVRSNGHEGSCEMRDPARPGQRIPIAGPYNAHPCCTSHVVRGLCCDPNDCGPCCPECPTCPTLARQRAQSATDVIALVEKAQERVDQLEEKVGSYDNVLPLGPALAELVLAWQGSASAELRSAGWRLGLLVDHPLHAAELVRTWRDLGEI